MAESSWFRAIAGHRGRATQEAKAASSDDGKSTRSITPLNRLAGLDKGPEPEDRDTTTSDSYYLRVNEADRVWHSPSVDQMAETLRTVMMTRSASDPIPREYNSHVLHLIEGYCSLKNRLMEAERQMAEQSVDRHDEKERATGLRMSWAREEETYRAEIKRLEKIIHTGSQGGLQAVMIARSGSLIRRRGDRSTEEEEEADDNRGLVHLEELQIVSRDEDISGHRLKRHSTPG
ncbi:hypothetical protein B0I35DRAFT_80143 [Stachybotrys elegans]|uniref:Uncharacterized protein n=1 Tax=Stachybotrys elegans TaxID=80388 RepID=A0A8K0WMV3_9HYPO|nr:hypothetical protein B0I35DRAFT_80143 [Stachybotrys elegans]